MSSIHGHEVMQMMLASDKRFTVESLIAEITRTYGTEARFHTCSASEMDAAAIVEFLAHRGKFVFEEDGFNTDASLICSH